MNTTRLEILLNIYQYQLGRSEIEYIDLFEYLIELGFKQEEVSEQMQYWYRHLSLVDIGLHHFSESIRIFVTPELDKLSIEVRGFIHFLENLCVMNALDREKIIQQAMLLPVKKVGIKDIAMLIKMELLKKQSEWVINHQVQLASNQQYTLH